MEKIIIIRYCEIHLKGKNRNFFESLLEKNIRKAVADIDCVIEKAQSRYLVKRFSDFDYDIIVEKLLKISGIHSFAMK